MYNQIDYLFVRMMMKEQLVEDDVSFANEVKFVHFPGFVQSSG
jgi:hypothetical protein